jgi:hypothetical protein
MKNPEEDIQNHYNGLKHSKMQHANRFGSNDLRLVGHLYSPRSQSFCEPGFIRHQGSKQSKKNLLGCLQNSKVARIVVENGAARMS